MSQPTLRPRETVILADDFDRLVDWYRDVLGFRVRRRFEDGMHYANLETDSGIEVGIGLASEMQVTPVDRSSNTVLLQFEAEDVQGLLDRIAEGGGTVQFGPSFNAEDEFWFGAFADPEGNPCWVVGPTCPR